MSHPTFSYPLDPLVARNSFRTQRYRHQEIVPFQEARSYLPTPLLPQHPTWEEMYWRAWEIAWRHLRQPKSGSGFVANYVDCAMGDNIYMWHNAFMAHFGVYARQAYNFLSSLDNFYAKQHDDGFICREINTREGYDCFYPFDPNGTGPNVLAWAEWRAFRHTRDEERLSRVFWPLAALHRWYRRYRTWPGGLYWATGLSSGMDNQPRTPQGALHHGHTTWIDANAQAALNCWVLAQMAQLLGETDLAESFNAERTFLHREVNARLWNEKTEYYHDVDAAGRFSPLKTIGAFWALLDKEFVPEERLVAFLSHLREVEAFNRPHRVPSLAADGEAYAPETGDRWRGGVWSPTNYVVLKGLRRARQYRLAHQIAVNHLQQVAHVFERTDTFWENYAPEREAPGEGARPHFVGWTGVSAISILLEDVIGISVDWPLRQVTWDRRLAEGGQYGIRNLPLGSDATLDIVGDDTNVEITSSISFSLTIRTEQLTLQTAVPAGTTLLPLS